MKQLLALTFLLSTGCAHTMASAGLTDGVILQIAKDRWEGRERWKANNNIPLSASAEGVRDVKCDWNYDFKLFDCQYVVEWRSDDGRSGSEREWASIGKDKDGNWSELIIVT